LQSERQIEFKIFNSTPLIMIFYLSDFWFILFANEISRTKSKIPATIPNCNNTKCILIFFWG
jgi:hypothetical protein